MRRRPTPEDLRVLNCAHLDPNALTVTIDPDDLLPPDWDAITLEDGVAHRRRLFDKYVGDRGDDLASGDAAVIYALLDRNEHPVMAERRDRMRGRI